MLTIDFKVFVKNLRFTQEYCEQQLGKKEKHFAAILRSINPDFCGKKIFSFNLYRINKEIPYYTYETKWLLEPQDKLWNILFEEQISFKQQSVSHIISSTVYAGDIFVFNIEDTLVDGAACIASFGLLDDYNCPPIDTWFYLIKDGRNNILFAWIPANFISYVNDGIEVNPENCIDWFKIWYPNQYVEFMAKYYK